MGSILAELKPLSVVSVSGSKCGVDGMSDGWNELSSRRY